MEQIIVKWSGKEYKITGLSETDSIGDLKCAIEKETCVKPERQKLLGLKFKGNRQDNTYFLIFNYRMYNCCRFMALS